MIPPIIYQILSEKKSTSIHIGPDLLQNHPFLKTIFSHLGRRIAILADEAIRDSIALPLVNVFKESGMDVELISFQSGEAHKNRVTLVKLETALFEKGFSKEDALIAVGGGSTLDLVGFLAATFCRGIPCVYVPTTLLAMVDASIGGKTGINTPYGKNLLGALSQPRFVIADINTLKTLPARAFRDGLAECIKHAALFDEKLFNNLETQKTALFDKELSVLIKVVEDNCKLKAHVVEEDQHDKGKRNLLNFGHTIGHALEKASHYTLTHGEAVALGMLYESLLFVEQGLLDKESYVRLHTLIKNYGFPLSLPPIDEEVFLEALLHDKKNQKGLPCVIGIEKIGKAHAFAGKYCTPIDPRTLLKVLKHDLHHT